MHQADLEVIRHVCIWSILKAMLSQSHVPLRGLSPLSASDDRSISALNQTSSPDRGLVLSCGGILPQGFMDHICTGFVDSVVASYQGIPYYGLFLNGCLEADQHSRQNYCRSQLVYLASAAGTAGTGDDYCQAIKVQNSRAGVVPGGDVQIFGPEDVLSAVISS